MKKDEIINLINWAVNTIRDKEKFGRDELSASRARELRAKGVLLDCKKYILNDEEDSDE